MRVHGCTFCRLSASIPICLYVHTCYILKYVSVACPQVKLVTAMWHPSPAGRPTMAQVVRLLAKVSLTDVTDLRDPLDAGER